MSWIRDVFTDSRPTSLQKTLQDPPLVVLTALAVFRTVPQLFHLPRRVDLDSIGGLKKSRYLFSRTESAVLSVIALRQQNRCALDYFRRHSGRRADQKQQRKDGETA
jgi:hypothetical protein